MMNKVIKIVNGDFDVMEMPKNREEKSKFIHDSINDTLGFNYFPNNIDLIVSDNWIANANNDPDAMFTVVLDTKTDTEYIFYGNGLIAGLDFEEGDTVPLTDKQLKYIEDNFIIKLINRFQLLIKMNI